MRSEIDVVIRSSSIATFLKWSFAGRLDHVVSMEGHLPHLGDRMLHPLPSKDFELPPQIIFAQVSASLSEFFQTGVEEVVEFFDQPLIGIGESRVSISIRVD